MLIIVRINILSMLRSLLAQLRNALELLGVAQDSKVVLILGGV